MISGSFRLVLSAFLLGTVTLSAQQIPVATPPGTPPEKPKLGYFRFWNMMPEGSGELSLLQDKGAADAPPLLVAAPVNFFASYLPTKPGRFALKVVRANDPLTALKTFDVILKADVYVTFLAHPVNGKLEIDMLDDTYDPTKALTGKVILRQFAPNVSIAITSTAIPIDSPPLALAYGEVRVLENLPLKPVLFRMRATLATGKTASWSAEVDFRNCRHATLLLVQDPHGRFRPRMCPDGQPEMVFSEKPLP